MSLDHWLTKAPEPVKKEIKLTYAHDRDGYPYWYGTRINPSNSYQAFRRIATIKEVDEAIDELVAAFTKRLKDAHMRRSLDGSITYRGPICYARFTFDTTRTSPLKQFKTRFLERCIELSPNTRTFYLDYTPFGDIDVEIISMHILDTESEQYISKRIKIMDKIMAPRYIGE
jgi:hypothetical protein